ncbi:MAG: hypothetical protein WD739_07595 [Actinomycetota bacterium]
MSGTYLSDRLVEDVNGADEHVFGHVKGGLPANMTGLAIVDIRNAAAETREMHIASHFPPPVSSPGDRVRQETSDDPRGLHIVTPPSFRPVACQTAGAGVVAESIDGGVRLFTSRVVT